MINSIILIGLAAVVALVVKRLRKEGNMLFAANSITSGTHTTGLITRLAEAAIETRYLLGKKGTNAVTQAVVAGADDIPDFVITDEAEVAGDPIGCAVLGCADGTRLMVASAAIDAASVHFLVPAASGKVQALPGPAAEAATYYVVGKPLTSATADGDPLEVAHCTPYPVAVAATP